MWNDCVYPVVFQKEYFCSTAYTLLILVVIV